VTTAPYEPQTPQQFIEAIRALIRAGQVRQVLALGDQYGRQFLPAFSPEELNRVSAMMESAQMAVDLEDWEARQRQDGAARKPVAAAKEALHAEGRAPDKVEPATANEKAVEATH
jgi:hypothetical protein